MTGKMVLVALLLCAGSAHAVPRMLDVPPDKSWQHARTGLILRPVIGGMAREGLSDFGADEVDLAASYNDAATATVASIFLFHPGTASVPIWFDRAQAALLEQKRYGTPDPASPVAFAIAPGGIADSLRVTYAMHGGDLRATALAAVPIGEWLLIVRLSSSQLDSVAIDARLTALLQGINWPASRTPAAPAAPVAACAVPLTYKKAQVLPVDMAQVLINSIAPEAAHEANKGDSKPITYCRDREGANAQWATYRPGDETKAYLMALGDGGQTISVSPALVLNGRPSYSVTLYGLDRRTTYPNVSALLPPEQAYELVTSNRPLSSTSTLDADGKKSININTDAIKGK